MESAGKNHFIWRVADTNSTGRAHLWVRELQASDGEHDLSDGDENVLGDLPADVNVVGLHILKPAGHNIAPVLANDKAGDKVLGTYGMHARPGIV